MTNIGILGAGRVGTNLAGKLSTAGHHVTLGSRNPEGTAARTAGPAPRIAFAACATPTWNSAAVRTPRPSSTMFSPFCKRCGRTHCRQPTCRRTRGLSCASTSSATGQHKWYR
ncbi:NAD(P)-binding domain-containing protein [Streptomyces sp. NPDC048258]|uniref:NAD(P)-binding domain-containing protein n=1 Tax=Streptomyces sp. NPDC048258 TaxID=3365527 RepID=UPI003722D5D0